MTDESIDSKDTSEIALLPNTIKATNDGCTPGVKALREFLKQCPYLPEYYKCINVNYLGSEADEFMIESIPGETVLKRYINGDSIRQYQFYFASREVYTKDVIENLENISFYENFAGWLEECTKEKVLPELEGKQYCLGIEAVTSGYAFDTQNGKAQYIIQCNMKYFQQY